ncbi:diguanylate cyclase [Ruminococcus sp.]|uniref:sensor domain-containing diguanylate cyclase n=1 Tax=Ruminococcus sp. TaxID=41978 RepID=UPI0025D54371|nr:diguanylate cyclase [Ruminococcus sp.]MBQ8966096.1 diguanylate cyclase [Ruminococcus sp.]
MAKSKAKKKEKKKGGLSLNLVLIFQLIIMLGLSLAITKIVSDRTKNNSDAQLNMTTDERAQVILNYVEVSERQLKDFSKAKQVSELLLDPDNEELTSVAQSFTRDFGLDIPYLEGIYISKWDTTVLTHSSMTGSIGKATRTGDSLKLLQDAMTDRGKEVYNTGIMISPASGEQIVSMYKAIYGPNGKPIGMVGMGLKTNGLINTLDRISGANANAADADVQAKRAESALSNASYYMLKCADSTFIFNKDDEKVGQEVNISELRKLCEEFAGTNTDANGQIEFSADGTDYVSSYVYIAKYGWIFTVNAPKTDVYALTYAMRWFLGAFGVIIVALTVVFFFINKRQERINQKLVSTLAKNAQTRQSLNTAMFKDVLTNANNRVSFSMDMESADVSAEKPCYFMMFNILGFSEINTRYGNDAGDRLLVRTVETLNDIFPDRAVYRTGSDEFVVMVPTEAGQPAPEAVLNDVNTAFRQLMVPEKIENMGAIYPKYKIAVIKRNGAADTSVVSALKDMTNRKGEATYGMIDYREM